MNSTLTMEIRNVYGKDLIFPACDTSRALLGLTDGRKSFAPEHIRILKGLGYAVEVKAPSL